MSVSGTTSGDTGDTTWAVSRGACPGLDLLARCGSFCGLQPPVGGRSTLKRRLDSRWVLVGESYYSLVDC